MERQQCLLLLPKLRYRALMTPALLPEHARTCRPTTCSQPGGKTAPQPQLSLMIRCAQDAAIPSMQRRGDASTATSCMTSTASQKDLAPANDFHADLSAGHGGCSG